MRYLITGHTGFKGSWLSLLLSIQGHKVSGISLKPENKSLYNQADLHDIFDRDLRCDIRNANEIKKIIESEQNLGQFQIICDCNNINQQWPPRNKLCHIFY